MAGSMPTEQFFHSSTDPVQIHAHTRCMCLCVLYMYRGTFYEPGNQLQFALIFPFSHMGKNVERHTLTLWTLASFNIHPCHMGEAQDPGLMQRKVVPSWPGVLKHSHASLFTRQQQESAMRLRCALHSHSATYCSFNI